MLHPRDMSVSRIHKCLYIMEVGHFRGVLLCLDAATGDVRAQCSITGEGRNLAVDQHTGNVLLTCEKEIVEYDHNGQKIRVIALPDEGMDFVWLAVPLCDKKFVICQVSCDFDCCRILVSRCHFLFIRKCRFHQKSWILPFPI